MSAKNTGTNKYVPKKMGQKKGDSKMPYLYVKWNSWGPGLPADVY